MELEQLAQQAIAIVKQAGELIRSIPRPHVYTKEGHANFVTEADMASQRFLIERLSPLLPEAHFFAEEQEENKMAPGWNWVIDPIDGTTNFIRGYRPSSISVGLVKDGVGMLGIVLDPFAGELFSAVKGGGAFRNGEPIHVADIPLENALVAFGTAPYYQELKDATFAGTCAGAARRRWICATWPRASWTASSSCASPPGITPPVRLSSRRRGLSPAPPQGRRSPLRKSSPSWRARRGCIPCWRSWRGNTWHSRNEKPRGDCGGFCMAQQNPRALLDGHMTKAAPPFYGMGAACFFHRLRLRLSWEVQPSWL